MNEKIYELKIDKNAYLEALIKHGKNIDIIKFFLRNNGHSPADDFYKETISFYEKLELTLKIDEIILREIWNDIQIYIGKNYECRI